MLLDLARARLTPKPLVLVLDQKLLDDALADGRCYGVVGEGDVVAKDVAERRVPVRALEGRAAAVKHLVDEDTKRPPALRISILLPVRSCGRTHQSTAEE